MAAVVITDILAVIFDEFDEVLVILDMFEGIKTSLIFMILLYKLNNEQFAPILRLFLIYSNELFLVSLPRRFRI